MTLQELVGVVGGQKEPVACLQQVFEGILSLSSGGQHAQHSSDSELPFSVEGHRIAQHPLAVASLARLRGELAKYAQMQQQHQSLTLVPPSAWARPTAGFVTDYDLEKKAGLLQNVSIIFGPTFRKARIVKYAEWRKQPELTAGPRLTVSRMTSQSLKTSLML